MMFQKRHWSLFCLEYKYKTIDELYKEIGLGNKIPKLIALENGAII
jgi:hypothetical protein